MFTVVTAAVPARCLSPDRTRHQFTKLSRSGARTPACRITKASYRSPHSAAVPALGDLAPQRPPAAHQEQSAPDPKPPLTCGAPLRNRTVDLLLTMGHTDPRLTWHNVTQCTGLGIHWA